MDAAWEVELNRQFVPYEPEEQSVLEEAWRRGASEVGLGVGLGMGLELGLGLGLGLGVRSI